MEMQIKMSGHRCLLEVHYSVWRKTPLLLCVSHSFILLMLWNLRKEGDVFKMMNLQFSGREGFVPFQSSQTAPFVTPVRLHKYSHCFRVCVCVTIAVCE